VVRTRRITRGGRRDNKILKEKQNNRTKCGWMDKGPNKNKEMEEVEEEKEEGRVEQRTETVF